MPRITRAALRSNAALEDTDPAASVQLSSTPRKERPPLGEIAGNGLEHPYTDDDSCQIIKAQNKGATKVKKGSAPKKTKPENNALDDARVEVLDDDNRSTSSSAVKEACEELSKDQFSVASLPAILPDKEPDAPSPLVIDVHHEKDLQDSTSLGDAEQQNQEATPNSPGDEDSFVDVIKSRTPASVTNTVKEPVHAQPAEGLEPVRSEGTTPGDKSSDHKQESSEDSFVDKIVLRSPAKMVTRIEDSVEAIDAFEDEIEKVGELLPTISDAASPVKTKKHAKAITTNAASMPTGAGTTKHTRSKAVAPTARSKAVGTSQGNQKHRMRTGQALAKNKKADTATTFDEAIDVSAKRTSSINKAPFLPVKSTKPPTKSNFELPGAAISLKLKQQREERLKVEAKAENMKAPVKPAPKAVKSSKPLTRSNFELPGDAVARKLKEQRESRRKQQEDDAPPEKRGFKARPVLLSRAPVVKGTATSKARMSLAKGESGGIKDSHDRAPMTRPVTKRPGSLAPTEASITSALSVLKRASQPAANHSPRITRGPPLAAASPSRLSMPASAQRITSDGKSSHQTPRGREVYERSKAANEELERVRKEKEEAAKKARAEAAERGRIASRQWAEKQKLRKVSSENGVGQKAASIVT